MGPTSHSWVGYDRPNHCGVSQRQHSITDILNAYPYQASEDVQEALAYAAWPSEEVELPFTSG